MNWDVVYFDDEILISKKQYPSETWKEKLYFFIKKLSFNSNAELIEFLTKEHKIENEIVETINGETIDDVFNFVLKIDRDKNEVLQIIKTSLDFIGNKGSLVYWEDWSYVFTKINDVYYLWIYIGGIAEQTKEIILSEGQKKNYMENGKIYIKELSEELRKRNSTAYEEAIRENRRIL